MIPTGPLRVLRTSIRACPPSFLLRSTRRHVPSCVTPQSAPLLSFSSAASRLSAVGEASKSSTTTTATSAPTHETNVTRTRPTHTLSPTAANPPATTRPPPLNLPARDATKSTLSFYFATGKAYLTFYKTGLQHIYLNTRLVWSLNAAAGIPRADTPPSTPSSSASSSSSPSPSPSQLPTAVRAVGSTTRATLLLRRRWRYDVRRLPVFALLLLVCGEFTPLVVMALPRLVPYTCRIPRQIEALQRKTEERRDASFRRLYENKVDISPSPSSSLSPPPSPQQQQPQEGHKMRAHGGAVAPTAPPNNNPRTSFTDAQTAAHIARSLNLISPLWDRTGGLVPDAAVALLAARRRAQQHIALVREDDALLVQAGGVDALDCAEEVVLACADRAIATVARTDGELREELRRWLGYVSEQSDEATRARILTDRFLRKQD